MKRLALAGCLAGLLLVGVSPATAETVPLGFKQDTSAHPSVFFSPQDLERAESFQVIVTADPSQPFEYGQYTSCRRGSESISLQAPDQIITPPFSITVLPTLAEPDSCWISVSVEAPIEKDVPGTVRVEVTGNRRLAPLPPIAPQPAPTPLPSPSSSSCAAPDFLQSGQTKVYGAESCGRARVIATKAWRKPAQAGNVVAVRGYSCRRTRFPKSAMIRCTKGSVIISVAGKLR